jgi:hypothetical protein
MSDPRLGYVQIFDTLTARFPLGDYKRLPTPL